MDKVLYTELIKLSGQKGFMSYDKLIGVKEHYYPMWMAELQKWLRDKHNWFLGIECDYRFDYHGYNIDCSGIDLYEASEIGGNQFRYNTYEEALEVGLLKSLKLIKQ